MSRDERDISLGSAPPKRSSGTAVALVVGVLIGALVVVFAWINAEPVPVDLVLWRPEVSKSLLIFVPLVLGVGLGWSAAVVRLSRSRRRREAEQRKDRGK